jgi:RNA polymerase sigma-70 factor (ECF subfamily)
MTTFDLMLVRSSINRTRPRGPGQGCRDPVSDLLEEWVPRVYRFALRLCNNPHIAEDLAQETFLRAWRHRGRLREERAAGVWLFRITANLWRDQLRRNRSPVARAGPLENHEPGYSRPPERQLAAKEELNRTFEIMNTLPPRQREVLYLSACECLASAEIAEVLGISRDTVKANLSLARKKMREQLPNLFPGPSSVE